MNRRLFLQILGISPAAVHIGKLAANEQTKPLFGKIDNFRFYESGRVKHVREYAVDRDEYVNQATIIHKGQMHYINWYGSDPETYKAAIDKFSQYLKMNHIDLINCEPWIDPLSDNECFIDNELIKSIG